MLYFQNLCLDDFQLGRLIEALKSNKKIIGVNLGEVGNVSKGTWEKLVDAILETNVCFMYVNESQAGPRITAQLKTLTKTNRDTTTSSVDWRLVDVQHQITKMWWNPMKSTRLGSIP